MTISDWIAIGRAAAADQPDIEDYAANLPSGDYGGVNCLWDNFSDDGIPALISASPNDESGTYELFFLYDGTPLPELTRRDGIWYYLVSPVGGLIEVLDLNTASYYDMKTMDCVFRTYLGYEAD